MGHRPVTDQDRRWPTPSAWNDKTGDTRTVYLEPVGPVTLAALIERLAELAPGVSFDNVQLNFMTASWVRDATEEELADRDRVNAQRAARQQAWELQTWRNLNEKYGKKD